MKLVKNAAGRFVPTEVNGEPQIPFKGVDKYKPSGVKAKPQIRTCIDYPSDGNKVIKDLKTALNDS
jgi:citrate lyase subunit alpha/citrate CoA-transferase